MNRRIEWHLLVLLWSAGLTLSMLLGCGRTVVIVPADKAAVADEHAVERPDRDAIDRLHQIASKPVVVPRRNTRPTSDGAGGCADATGPLPTISRVPGGAHGEIFVNFTKGETTTRYKLAMPARTTEICDDQRVEEFCAFVRGGGNPHFFFCPHCRTWMIGKDASWVCCQQSLGPHKHGT